MKKWIKGLAWTLVVVALAAGAVRALEARKTRQQQAVADAARTQAPVLFELADSDVVKVQTRELAQGLTISGSLRAASTAVVKARVAGELKGLTLREGDAVKAGQIVATVDDAEFQARVNQALRLASAAKAQIDIAQRQVDNNKALVDQGFISRTALDTSLATLEGAKATYEAATAGADLARKSLDDTVLRAPISGLVSQRLAQPGERVAIDGRIIEIMDLSRLELEATLSAGDSMSVRLGQTATLQIEGSATTVKARVVRINPSAQPGSRSVLVYLSIDNPAGLRQGLFAQGTLGTARVSVLAIPLSAVRTDKPAAYVQVVDNKRVVHKPVSTGLRGDDANDPASRSLVAVTGLSEGETVIKGALGSLREGTAITFTAGVR
jgi:RND family efflux transporter MFP subunit